MIDEEPQISDYEGYRKLKSFRMAQLVYNVTMQFCDRYVDEQSQAYDKMVQAARNGAQKIADGSHAGETSKKKEMNLTKVARTSLGELRREYESFLEQQELSLWEEEDPRLADLIALHPRRVNDVAKWANKEGSGGTSESPQDAQAMANGALALIARAISLIDRQLSSQNREVQHEAYIAESIRFKHLSKRG